MVWTVFVSLSMVWLLAVLNGYALGGFIQLLLLLAVIVLILSMIFRRRVRLRW
jgi:hypothetical protein